MGIFAKKNRRIDKNIRQCLGHEVTVHVNLQTRTHMWLIM